MLTEKIDFSSYSKEKLIEALESVDDMKYPENAVKIYSLLESKLISEKGSIDAKYNEDEGFLDNVLDNVLSVVLFPVHVGQGNKNSEMQEKLLRIRKLVAANET